MTVTSRAASLPPHQPGMRRSAGLLSVPGMRALLDGGEARLDGLVEEAVAEQVVPPGALASCAAAETVVSQGPFWVAFQLQNGGH